MLFTSKNEQRICEISNYYFTAYDNLLSLFHGQIVCVLQKNRGRCDGSNL